MQYNEYEALKAKAKEEYDRNLEAIERVWKLSGQCRPQTPESSPPEAPHQPTLPAPRPAVANANGNGHLDLIDILDDYDPPNDTSIAGRIRAAITQRAAGVPFTVLDISDMLPDVNKTTISSTMKRLAENGQVKVVEQGAGRRATKFIRLSGRE
jgi:hypothetical protein